MYDNNTIEEATYLNKSNGDYIPLRIEMTDANFSKI